SHWVSLYAAPPATPPDPIRKETADSLLRKLVEQNDPAHSGARFVLAVMLERKRLLKVKAQINEENGRVFIYEHGSTGDLFHIPDPNLQLDQLEEVQRDVAQLLEHGLDSTAGADHQTAAIGSAASATVLTASANISGPVASSSAAEAELSTLSGNTATV